ncbi:uncharacterized protein LOC112524234 isoform X2 [Cynara cardunculus var. scolymus]|uniref:uncharacterized protein LOC112524234 isoform X2 n=1 Tax=Cynara cardunculus var. scolymus TaxID=59895 RepID=UPI000D62B525|nr:uncharacterized protein LOC112524234 isoform X2 [Cynara cardunculus var. scolymus]
MSRCFPYPPPGYSRNGATYEALIESIKKETDKAKAERKKQKRAKKDKKEKEKRKDEEKGKLQKNPNEYQHDACKVLQSSVGSKEAHNKRTEPTVELLEKSDLTEEHGQPISSHKPSYSSDSTQNSNKRKRDDAIVPDGTGGHGKPIKIRLLKKQKGPDSSKETLCSNSGRTDPQSLAGADARLNTWKISTSRNTNPPKPSTSNLVNGLRCEDRTPLVSGNRNTGVPATSGRENIAVHRNLNLGQTKSTWSSENPETKNNDLQGLRFSRKPSPSLPSSGRPILPSSQLKHEIPSSVLNKTGIPVPSRSSKSDVDVPHPSRQQPIPSHGRSVPPQIHLKHELPPNPTLSVPPPSLQGFHSGRDEQSTPSSGMSVRPTGKRSISEITVPVNSSKEQKVEPTRFEKKLQKKHSKYEKLIGSWIPAVLEVPPPVDDDQDWLSRSEKKGSRSSTSRADVDTCHESAACLWQPCARFLAEVDIHALPYTVPF